MSDLIETKVGMVSKSDLNKWNLIIHYMEPIIKFYEDPEITEIMVNRYDKIFIEGRKGKVITDARFESEEDLRRLIRQLAIVLSQDKEKIEVLDARFPDQSRACCTMPIISPRGSTITLRCAPKITLTFKDLVNFGSLTDEMCNFLRQRVEKEDNIIVSGSTASGKTTVLRALAEYIPDITRVLVAEDTQELLLNLPNVILMEAPKRTGSEIDLSFLIKTTLRQAPDRVFVGEIRDAFACDAYLTVINTGHNGCATSIHANNPSDAIRRMQYLLTKEGLLDYELAGREIKNSVHLLIHADKTCNGKRITNISSIDKNGNIKPIFTYNEDEDIHIKMEE